MRPPRRGAVFCIAEAAHHLGIDLKTARVAIQGFGNAGSIAATLMAQRGREDRGGQRFVRGHSRTGWPGDPAGARLEGGARHGCRLPRIARHQQP